MCWSVSHIATIAYAQPDTCIHHREAGDQFGGSSKPRPPPSEPVMRVSVRTPNSELRSRRPGRHTGDGLTPKLTRTGPMPCSVASPLSAAIGGGGGGVEIGRHLIAQHDHNRPGKTSGKHIAYRPFDIDTTCGELFRHGARPRRSQGLVVPESVRRGDEVAELILVISESLARRYFQPIAA